MYRQKFTLIQRIQTNAKTLQRLSPIFSVVLISSFLLSGVLSTNKIMLSGSDVTVELLSGDLFVVDKKDKCSAEPNAAYVGFEFCNITADTLTDLAVTLTDFTNANFELEGGQLATQSIGALPNGACIQLYWYVTYDCNTIGSTTDMSVKIHDATPDTVTEVFTFTTDSYISASAGGDLVGTSILGGGAIGSVTVATYKYSFGSIPKNGSLIYQPAGNADFDAECFQLIGVEIAHSDVNGISVGEVGKLAYDNLPKTTGSGNELHVKYFFKHRCANITTQARGYAASLSGTILKNTSNIGDPSLDFTLPTATNSLQIDKTVSSSSGKVGDIIKYTIALENTAATYISVDTIIDILPEHFSFVSIAEDSDVTLPYSAESPNSGDIDTLMWVGSGTSDVYPYTSYLIEPNSTIYLTYYAKVEPEASLGEYINLAEAIVGTYQTPQTYASLCIGGNPCTLGGEWIAFEGDFEEQLVHLKWLYSTAVSEVGNFLIERSVDGTQFSPIGNVKMNSSNRNEPVSFADINLPQNGENSLYYKVVFKDDNGQSSLSHVIEISPPSISEFHPTVYYNSSNKQIVIRNESGKKVTSISILNGSGQSVISNDFIHNEVELFINMHRIVAGVYYVRLISEGKVFIKKVMVI